MAAGSPVSNAPDLRKYLADAIASEIESERHLRTLVSEADEDEDVKAAFGAHADETAEQSRQLTARFNALFGAAESPSPGAALLHFDPTHLVRSNVPEERILQNLLVAYTAETGEVALYEGLAALAIAARDRDTELLARKLQNEERRAANQIWHFLGTRSKIAFNMLTVSEIDPAVETKTADDRITS